MENRTIPPKPRGRKMPFRGCTGSRTALPKVCPFNDQVACIEEACILFTPNAGCTLKSLCLFGTLAACLLSDKMLPDSEAQPE